MSRNSIEQKGKMPTANAAANGTDLKITVTPLKPMASASQLARLLHCEPRTIHEWRRLGKIPYYRIGRIIVFDWDEVRAHLGRTCHVPATNLPQQAAGTSIANRQ